MNTTKLTDKQASLKEALKQTLANIQELDTKKNELIANANAIQGAILVIDDLLKEDVITPDESNTCSDKVVPISQ